MSVDYYCPGAMIGICVIFRYFLSEFLYLFGEKNWGKLLDGNSVVKLYCVSVCIYLDEKRQDSGGSSRHTIQF